MNYIYTNGLTYPDTRQITETAWLLEQPFIAEELDDNGNKIQVLIPNGFITDYRSGPDEIDGLIPKSGKYSADWITHDFTYSAELFSRSTCDWNLLLDLKANGMNWIKRNSVWLSVRFGGYFVWNKHTIDFKLDSRLLQENCRRELCNTNNKYGIVYMYGKYVKKKDNL